MKASHLTEEGPDVMEMQLLRLQLADVSQENRPNIQLLERRDAFFFALEPFSTEVYYPHIVGGIQANELPVRDAMVVLWSKKSAISQELYRLLLQKW